MDWIESSVGCTGLQEVGVRADWLGFHLETRQGQVPKTALSRGQRSLWHLKERQRMFAKFRCSQRGHELSLIHI